MTDTDARGDEDSPHTTGVWIGDVEGLQIREPGPNADGPVLEIHGTRHMAAMEFSEEIWVDGLTEAAAEIQTVFDEEAMLDE